jgi:mannosylfructose-phosphate synthase
MLTTHGIHQWRVVPGLPDTGGQNVFVNQLSATLAKQGFKVTIANRGGYLHPITGERQQGLHYKDEHQRIIYLEDGVNQFIRKEELGKHIPSLAASMMHFLETEGNAVDLMISHYWDAAKIGVLLNRSLPHEIRHVWVPHSLGTVKQRNVSPPKWGNLRIEERIAAEGDICRAVNAIVATSATIRRALQEDYEYPNPIIFLPPCVDPARFHPRQVPAEADIWAFLSQHSGLSPDQIRDCKIVTEISRTDPTKRKDVLIKAFARVHQRFPNTLLVIISIDESQSELARQLKTLIRTLEVEDHTIVLGSVWDELPDIYAVTDIYCTPSIMEGFGMSAQEAAATGVPVIASHLVPFVIEYLLGQDKHEIERSDKNAQPLCLGQGAIVVPADDVDGFSQAIEILLTDEALRQQMGINAYRITIPYFTWDNRIGTFLTEIGVH